MPPTLRLVGYGLYGGNPFFRAVAGAARKYLYAFERAIAKSTEGCRNVTYYGDYEQTKALASEVIGLGCKWAKAGFCPAKCLS